MIASGGPARQGGDDLAGRRRDPSHAARPKGRRSLAEIRAVGPAQTRPLQVLLAAKPEQSALSSSVSFDKIVHGNAGLFDGAAQSAEGK